MPDSMKISEISPYLRKPLRSLEDYAASQAHFAEMRRQAALYLAFQQMRDFLTKLMNTEDVTMQFDHATSEEGWRVLREAERF